MKVYKRTGRMRSMRPNQLREKTNHGKEFEGKSRPPEQKFELCDGVEELSRYLARREKRVEAGKNSGSENTPRNRRMP